MEMQNFTFKVNLEFSYYLGRKMGYGNPSNPIKIGTDCIVTKVKNGFVFFQVSRKTNNIWIKENDLCPVRVFEKYVLNYDKHKKVIQEQRHQETIARSLLCIAMKENGDIYNHGYTFCSKAIQR